MYINYNQQNNNFEQQYDGVIQRYNNFNQQYEYNYFLSNQMQYFYDKGLISEIKYFERNIFLNTQEKQVISFEKNNIEFFDLIDFEIDIEKQLPFRKKIKKELLIEKITKKSNYFDAFFNSKLNYIPFNYSKFQRGFASY